MFATEYDNDAANLLGALKFQRNKSAAQVIARIMYENFPYVDKTTVLVPIPTASTRIRRRGYDQAQLITKQLAKIYRCETANYLIRKGGSRQVGSNREQRLKNLDNAFDLIKDIKNKNVLLIDDVLTTGATVNEAYRTLIRGGAHQVSALLYAAA